MLWALIKKDLQHLLKEKSVLILLFIMPIGLICILGFAQSNNELEPFSIAVVNAETQTEELNRFLDKAENNGIPREAANQFATEFNLKNILIEDVLESGLDTQILLETSVPLDEALANKEYAAIIEFPDGYQESIWKSIFLNEGDQKEVILHLNEEKSIYSQMVEGIIHSFYEMIRMQSLAGETEGMAILQPGEVDHKIIESQTRPIDIFDYVAVGMACMFVLYTAGLVSRYATDEKRTKVFDRMILSSAPAYIYGISKWITGTITAAFQLFIIFLISYIAFDVAWGSLLQFSIITLAISMTVGGLSVLLTSFNFRFDSYKASTLFTNIIVTMFAFIGGSFIQTDMLPPLISKLGEFTPNGTTMTAYFQAFQGGTFSSILPSVGILTTYSVILVAIAIMLFPKRRGQ
ncbi:ABC transporter permease [Alkalicoccobacillus murimartini]|uniref:ABC-2 type transport system permease protein n=1 Tax=Alkalicoccobacillus murimartini TaxID=171685 RepID=A0ABT9YKT2_9BACI|nr:ABC transporter permease [Alkalicoccobacillus murimartini]MDQ0208346.1 ABC-2 type transport system permease protein [Alkalicoccobacillus murimartini]